MTVSQFQSDENISEVRFNFFPLLFCPFSSFFPPILDTSGKNFPFWHKFLQLKRRCLFSPLGCFFIRSVLNSSHFKSDGVAHCNVFHVISDTIIHIWKSHACTFYRKITSSVSWALPKWNKKPKSEKPATNV